MRLLLGFCVLICASLSAADQSACKYSRREGFEKSECDPATGEKTLTLVLKKGDPNTCPPTKEMKRPCRSKNGKDADNDSNCHYEADDEDVECDPATGMKTIEMTLADGDPEECPTTKTVQRKCNNDEGRGRRKGRGKGKNKENKKGKGREGTWLPKCRYFVNKTSQEEEAIVCDPATSTKSITLQLKPGSPASCAPTRVITRDCVPVGCEYSPGEWSECTDETAVSERVDTLSHSADGVTCNPSMTRTRSCRKMAKIEERKQRKQDEKKKEKQDSKKERKNKMKNERKEERRQEKMERKQAKKEARKERKETRNQS